MSKMYEKLQKCVSIIREKTDFVPEVALILGSGLGEYARNMDVKVASLEISLLVAPFNTSN